MSSWWKKTKLSTRFLMLGFILAWLLYAGWFCINTLSPPGLRLGRVLEAITVIICPPSISLMASGDHLLPQLANMVVVSVVNGVWYWLLSKVLIWASDHHHRAAGI